MYISVALEALAVSRAGMHAAHRNLTACGQVRCGRRPSAKPPSEDILHDSKFHSEI